MFVKKLHRKEIEEFVKNYISKNEENAHFADKSKKLSFFIYAAQKDPQNRSYFLYLIDETLNVNRSIQVGGISAKVENGQRYINRFNYVFKDFEVGQFGNITKNSKLQKQWVAFLSDKFGEEYVKAYQAHIANKALQK